MNAKSQYCTYIYTVYFGVIIFWVKGNKSKTRFIMVNREAADAYLY
jgi:hypothetical protein